METPAPAASAQPTAAPATVSASVDAVNRSDFDAFDRAELAKRTGAPIADVPAPAPADADPDLTATPAAADGRTVSARQQKTNDAIRDAVTRATKETADRVAELERELAARPPVPRDPAAAPPPTAAKTPEYKRIMALPGAPKLAEFESVEEHAFAAAAFIDDVRTSERASADRTRSQADARVDGFLTRVKEAKADPTFTAAITAATTADPAFAQKLHALKPFASLGEGERGGPINAIGEQVYDSPYVKDVLLHFAQQPNELARLEAGPAQLAAVPIERWTDGHRAYYLRWLDAEFKRLEGRLAGQPASTTDTTAAPVVPAAAARSPITAAPPPPPTLRAAGSTSDPKAAALARSDFAEYDRLELEERMAKRAPAR